MAINRYKAKKRLESGSYLALPHNILNSAAFVALPAHSLKLLIDIAAQFKGHNNGDLCAAWSVMEKRGWKSRDTLNKSIKVLLESGFIEKTRQGGWRVASLYALSWKSIDECGGKLDVPSTRAPSNRWKKS